MNQRWPVMHRRSSGMGSMTALRYTGLRLSAGKHLGRVDGSSVGFEVETTLRFSVRSKPNLSTMPSFLERLGHVPHMGSGKGLGFRGFSSTHSDRSSLGLYSLSRRQLRQDWISSCHSFIITLFVLCNVQELYIRTDFRILVAVCGMVVEFVFLSFLIWRLVQVSESWRQE